MLKNSSEMNYTFTLLINKKNLSEKNYTYKLEIIIRIMLTARSSLTPLFIIVTIIHYSW